MIDKSDFKAIKKELERQEKERESTIQKSREIIKISKQIIYSLHRNDLKEAESKASEIKNRIKNLGSDSETQINRTAMQEYVEALTYLGFVKDKKIPTRKSLNVDAEAYLCGLCDLTGELVRKSVNLAINKDFNEAIKIKKLVEEIYGEMLNFDFRNSELRRKFDAIKYNLKKLEDLEYEIKMRK